MTTATGGAPAVIDGKVLTIYTCQSDRSWKIYCDCFNSSVPACA